MSDTSRAPERGRRIGTVRVAVSLDASDLKDRLRAAATALERAAAAVEAAEGETEAGVVARARALPDPGDDLPAA